MIILFYIILGIVQGIAEILPISSSGHLALTQALISDSSGLTQFKADTQEMLVFNIFTHFASLLALLVFFRKQLWIMIKGSWQFIFNTKLGRQNAKDLRNQTKSKLFDLTHDYDETNSSERKKEIQIEAQNIEKKYKVQRKLLRKQATKDAKPGFMLTVYMIMASIPVAIAGFLLKNWITSLFGELLFIGIAFMITGLLLLFVSMFTKKSSDSKYTWKNTMVTGIFQVFGIFPGISRSGVTMSGAKIAGLNDEAAKQFAFILFIPVAAGGFLLSLGDINLITALPSVDVIGFILGFITAFIMTGLGLLFIFKKFNLSHYKYFTIYLFIIGMFTIIYHFI